jgi:Stigma-specific protein, Stig1
MAGTACAGPATGSGTCCRDRCIDPSTWASDVANCGGCGHACGPGLGCKQGACVDPGTGSPPAWTCADQGHGCPEDSVCFVDACYPRVCRGDNDGLLCPDPAGGKLLGHCCGQVCADLFADPHNCRACGVHCAAGEICKSGDCVPPDP